MSQLTPQIPEPIPERSDIEKGIKMSYLLRAGHMGIMLDRTQRNLKRAERLERFAATGNVASLGETEPEEEMGVYLGNENHYHFGGTEVVAPPTPTAPTPPLVVTPAPPTAQPSTPDILVTPYVPKPPATPPATAPVPLQDASTLWEWLPLASIPIAAVALAYSVWPSTHEPVVTPPTAPVQQPTETPVDGQIGVTIR